MRAEAGIVAFSASVLAIIIGTARPASAGAPPLYGLSGFASGTSYEVTHTAVGAKKLTTFQVQIKVDTASEISLGRMNADCSDIRVYDGDGCSPTEPVNFWVADGTCNTDHTDIWLGLPRIKAGSTTRFVIFWGNPDAASESNGSAVFPIFFDDFNAEGVDTSKWNEHNPDQIVQTNGLLTNLGGGTTIWSVNKVMAAGKTVFGVRTDAQSAAGADIEYGAGTLYPTGPTGDTHWSNRPWTGVTCMAWNYAAVFVGTGSGSCAVNTDVGPKWTNDPGDSTFFQTEFFYELLDGGGTTAGIYDKFGARREYTLGGDGCSPEATERAYWQFDHSDSLPNPVSSLDYAYIRKYANPDPIVLATGTPLSALCGIPSGDGPCTADNAVETCQSGACSVGAPICIPDAGCYVDADCGGGQYCFRATLTCAPLETLGDGLPADGLHDACSESGNNAACRSGHCNPSSNTCADETGQLCTGAAGCVTNACGADGRCGLADDEGPCSQAAPEQCRSGACSVSGECIPAGSCKVDADCDAAFYCNTTAGTCAPALANGNTLPADRGPCASGGGAARACRSGACNTTANTCAGPNTSTACSAGRECSSNVCGADGKCGYADGTGACTSASATSCRSGTCSQTGVCWRTGGECTLDADCTLSEFCHAGHFSCDPLLGVGEELPADGAHQSCASGSNRACASGHCNPATLTCAGPNTTTVCAADDDCASNVCGDDGHCGFVNGTGSCTAEASSSVCRSGACDRDGQCGLRLDAECASADACRSGLCEAGRCVACLDDSACPLGSYCSEAHLCSDQLSLRSTCTRSTQCASGVCVGSECLVVTDATNLGANPGASLEGGSVFCGLSPRPSKAPPWFFVLLGVTTSLAGLRRARRARPVCQPRAARSHGLEKSLTHIGGGALFGATLLLAAPRALAQERGFAVDNFHPSEQGSEWFALDSLDLRGHRRTVLGLTGTMSYRPLAVYATDGSVQSSVVQNADVVHVGGSMFFWDQFRVALDVPVNVYTNGSYGVSDGAQFRPPANEVSLGDARLSGDVKLIGDYRAPFTLAAGLSLWAPTGQQTSYGSDGTLRAEPHVLVAGEAGDWVYAASLGVHFRNGKNFGESELGTQTRAGLAGGIRLLDRRLLVGPELFGHTVISKADAFFSRRATPVEGLIGAHYAVGERLRLDGGAGLGLTRGYGAPAFRALLSVEWSPEILNAGGVTLDGAPAPAHPVARAAARDQAQR